MASRGVPEPAGDEAEPRSSGWRSGLRRALPFAVSALLLVGLLSRIDAGAVWARLSPEAAWIFLPTLIAFLAASLATEAASLTAVVSHLEGRRDGLLAARIKAASYPLSLVHYALGAGAVALLLRHRMGLPVPGATGAVLLITGVDLLCLVATTLLALGLGGTRAGEPAVGLLVATVLLGVGALAWLRGALLPHRLARLRELAVLAPARHLPLASLAWLGVLRVAGIACFAGFTWGTLMAFDVRVPAIPLVAGVCVLLLVSALPIAVAGLGTVQLGFVALFSAHGSPEALLAASLTLSFGLIVGRAALGLGFAREFTAEAFEARQEIVR